MTVRKKKNWSRLWKLPKQKKKKNEHSEEWLNDFSQEAEEAVALKLTARKKKQKRMMSILRNGSIFSARKLKRLQHGSLQKQKKKRQTTFVLLICGNRLKPWKRG
jgi:hypothetical protein